MRLISYVLFAMLNFTVAHGQGYYPLEVGNLWEYWDCLYTFHDATVQTTGDTVLPNGFMYTVVQSSTLPGPGLGYIRQDSSRVYVFVDEFGYELLLYDFSKTTGDTVGINYYPGDSTLVTVVYDGFANVFGRTLRQWGFWEQSMTSSSFNLREVTDSLGRTYQTFEVAPYDQCLRGALINGIVYGTITTVDEDEVVPGNYWLAQNYPNPFNSSTVIAFYAPYDEEVSVGVFDVLGRKVKQLFTGRTHTQPEQIVWDGRNELGKEVGTGMYIYRIESRSFVSSKRMLVVR